MSNTTAGFRDLTQGVSAKLTSLRSSTPDVMKSFSELGQAATSSGVLDRKTKELIALALSVAARCDACIGFHMQTLVKLGVTRQELDETLGVTIYMGGGPSLMYADNAINAFEEFSRPGDAAQAVVSQRALTRFFGGAAKARRFCAVCSNCRAMLPQTRSHSA
jgi:AhpD family alkylhydroperoxidase